MDVAPEKFDVEFWLTIAKLVSKLAVVAVVALGGSASVENWADAEVGKETAKAGQLAQQDQTNMAYEDYYELLRYHAAQNASCDSALESFSRHRDDNRDWQHVIQECHSEGGWERPPAEDPSQ